MINQRPPKINNNHCSLCTLDNNHLHKIIGLQPFGSKPLVVCDACKLIVENWCRLLATVARAARKGGKV